VPNPTSDEAVGNQLRQVPLFAELDAAELQTLAASAQSFWKKPGVRLFDEGSPGDGCFVLTSGRVNVVRSGPGDAEIVLDVVQAPAIIGELALLDRSARSAGAVTVERSHFIKVAGDAFRELRRNSRFEDRLMVSVVRMLRRATEQLRAVYTYGSMDHLAWCLARVARQRGERIGSEIVISPRPRHHELAEMMGCARETVSRALLRLKRRKWVNWDKHSLRLRADVFRRYEADSGISIDLSR
jgi:CRP/FNR family transcriptional regulator, cyclic AMP receptor protein